MNHEHANIEALREANRRPASVPAAQHEGLHLGWWLLVVVLCLVLGAAAWHYYPLVMGGKAKSGDSAGGGGKGTPPVPVLTATATKGDLPIYLTGLGNVTPVYMVTIHTRVDGQLDQVLFKEGQIVHQGDLLAQIDPRPFQVQLTQAQGQMERDQALLKNAHLDLKRYEEAIQTAAVSQQQLDTQRVPGHPG